MNAIQLSRLEKKLITVMNIATKIDSCSSDSITKLIEAYRKIKLSRLLSNEAFVAIAGTQGAGKTTLISTIYNASEWLEANSGRGEQIPVFIEENPEIQEPEGIQLIYNSRTQEEYERKCSKEEFHSSITDWNYRPNEDERVIYVKLYVPVVYNFRFSWVLLPGYERENYKNFVWQRFMRYVLTHSIGVVLVTREERLAHDQSDIIEDLNNNIGAHKPIIAITRSEGFRDNQKKIADLTERAKDIYGVEENKIVFTGIDFENWKDIFADTVFSVIKQDYQVEQDKINTLLDVIDSDLTIVLDELQSVVIDNDLQHDSQQKAVENLLKHFNKASDEYRKLLGKKLTKQTEALVDNAIKKAKSDFDKEKEEASLVDKAKIFYKKIASNSNSVDDNRIQRVLKYFPATEIMQSNLSAINQASEDRLNLRLASHSVKDLSYSDSKVEEPTSSILDNKAVINSGLNTLLRKSSLSDLDSGKNAIEKALEYLPALAMEYSRLVQAKSLEESKEGKELLSKIESGTFDRHGLESVLSQVVQDFQSTSDSAKAVMGIVGSLVGLDMTDGKLDGEIKFSADPTNNDYKDTNNNSQTLNPANYATKAAILGTRMAGMAVALVAVAYTTYQISNTVALADRAHKEFISLYANQIGQQNNLMVLTQYDEHMERLSDFLRQNLEDMYCINNTDEKHQLMVALKQLKQVRKEVRGALKREQLSMV